MKTPNDGACQRCGGSLEGRRPDARFCSTKCYNATSRPRATERNCKRCGTRFEIKDRSDYNRKYCSRLCAKRACTKQAKTWKAERPGYMGEYNQNRVFKNPGVWVEKSRQNRLEAIAILGGVCVVEGCGVTKPVWLHIDYVPTTRHSKYRHPRGIAFIRAHLHLFRLLCANHHYELTLTGAIEGTDIQQPHTTVAA